MQLEIIEEEELLEGLLQLTEGNLGLSHQLLYKVIDRTREEVKGVLADMNQNIDRAMRHARRRAQRQARKNLKLSGRYEKWYENVSIHHIVAWGDERARRALGILLKYGIMPNDEANLILLPKYKEHTPHPGMENAKAHSETHTEIYHRGVLMTLVRVDVPGATRDDVIEALREIAMDLEEGVFSV